MNTIQSIKDRPPSKLWVAMSKKIIQYIIFAVLILSFSFGCIPFLDKKWKVTEDENKNALVVNPPYTDQIIKAKTVADSVACSMYGDSYFCYTIKEGKSFYFFYYSYSEPVKVPKCPYGCEISIKKRNLQFYLILCASCNFIK